MTAFLQKYESTVNPRYTGNSVNSLLGVRSTVNCILMSYSLPIKILPGLPVYHPENLFNLNLDVVENAGITSRESNFIKKQLCWARHVSRMPDHRLDYTIRRTLDRSPQQRRTEKALQRQAKEGTQCLQHSAQTLDCCKAADRIAWLCSVRQGAISFGANWRATLEGKILRRQSCAHPSSGISLFISY